MLFLSICMAGLITSGFTQAHHVPQVLVIHSYHQGFTWTDNIMAGLQQVLNSSGLELELMIEYLDAKRRSPKDTFTYHQELFRVKYKTPPDIIIVTDNAALDFVLPWRKALFPGTPVVFCGINNYTEAMLGGQTGLTGVAEDFDLKGTIELALRLHPKTKKLAVVSDATETGMINLERFREVRHFFPKLELSELTNITVEELKSGLKSLPADCLVLFLSFFKDRQGRIFSFKESTELVINNSPGPVYSAWDFVIRHGVVGGLVVSGRLQGENAARMAVRILKGEKAENIPVLRHSPNVPMFDYQQLDRFNLRVGDLPPGSVILNEPESFYYRNRYYVWATLVFVVFQGVAIIVLIRNVSRRRQAESVAQRHLKFLDTLINTIPSPVFYKDAQGRYLGCNRTFADLILGAHREAIRGQTVMELSEALSPEKARSLKEQDEKLLQFGGVDAMEATFRCTDGRHHDFIVSKGTFNDSSGRPAGVVGVMSDFTELRRANQALLESKERLRTITANAPGHIFQIDRQGTITFANRPLIGLNLENTLGAHVSSLFPPERMDTLRSVLDQVLVNGQGMEFCSTGPVGPEVRWYTWRLAPVLVDGRPESVIFIATDITDRKKQEEDRSQLEARLRQSEKMEAVGTLAGGIAHDFNNVLAAIIGYTELAQMTLTPGTPPHQNLEQVLRGTSRAKDLVKQILTFSRQGDQEKKPVDLVIIVKEIMKFIRASLPATIEINCQPELASATILGDPTQIHQILLNLCTNAAQAMKSGGGQLWAQVTAVELDAVAAARLTDVTPGQYYRISVQDTGAGIDSETMERIFEPFFTTKAPGEGTGMGLAVVHGIVKSHDGAIEVDSTVGQGTTFQVYLPALKTEVIQKPALEAPLPGGPERLLFVDDEPTLVEIGVLTLTRLGYQVTGLTSGSKAWEVFQAAPEAIDLVITDLTMPQMTGVELAEKMLNLRPGLPIILNTGYNDNASEEQIKAMGVREFLLKPLAVSDLARAVRRALDQNLYPDPGAD